MSTLLRLTLENVGLIAHAEIALGGGVTVVTGETGSGKTMLLGGLGLALGERADADVVRSGATRARATLEIAPDAALRARLTEAGFVLADDDDVIVQREVLAAGRSQARINGTPASASQLRELIGELVDVVSQHEAQRLLAPAFALDLLDRFAGTDALALRAEIARSYDALRAAQERVTALRDADGRALARGEFARYALAEIDAARIEDDEEDARLRERRDLLANAERILDGLAIASGTLEDERGAVDALGAAETALAGLGRLSPRFAELAGAAAALQSEANELAARIAHERDAIELDPAELDAVGERLDVLERLKRKYGGTLAAVTVQQAAFAAELADVDERDERLAQAERTVRLLMTELLAQADALHAQRQAAADAIADAVGAELTALAMPAARLHVALERTEHVGPNGSDRAEMRFAANPGEPERPLARVGSGGELSRVLLALVVVVADRRVRTALVFDEIDAGIGGATASAVGARLARLASSGQVVCVTHLAQIAAVGADHVALRKSVAGETTTITAVALDEDARRAEIARMLAGEEHGVALTHATELLAARRR